MLPIFAASVAVLAGSAAAQFTPLASKHFTYSALPYQADTDTGERGVQYGYNLCNATTEGPTSRCQTLIINSIDDFCLWAPPEPNSLVGNTEGEAVAWCTKKGHGTRLIPDGALTGVQFMRTPDYIQVTGLINQALINMAADDGGGEMDPHGADQRGNPLGGLAFTNAWGGGYQQIIEWHNFMGSNVFCLKACDPKGPNAAKFCEHIYDRIGCQYNAPAAYAPGVFESCLGDNQDFPGIYTGADGVVTTYKQPPESLGEIQTMPYTARIPASSSCTPFQSASIYAGLPSASVAAASTTSSLPASTSAMVTSRPAAVQTAAARSSSSAAATGSSAAGVPAKLGSGALWSLAVGAIGVLMGAVVAM